MEQIIGIIFKVIESYPFPAFINNMFNFIQNYRKYGDVLNYWDLLKAITILTMIIDHIGAYLLQDELWLRTIGRTHVPIWLFLAGYAQPKKRENQIIMFLFVGWLINTDSTKLFTLKLLNGL